MIWKIGALLIWGTEISIGLFIIKYLPQMEAWGYLAFPIAAVWIFAACVGVELWNE